MILPIDDDDPSMMYDLLMSSAEGAVHPEYKQQVLRICAELGWYENDAEPGIDKFHITAYTCENDPRPG